MDDLSKEDIRYLNDNWGWLSFIFVLMLMITVAKIGYHKIKGI